MSHLLENIQSPYWWITAVVLALLLNILSTYAREWIDRGLGMVSRHSRIKTATRAEIFRLLVDRLRNEPELATILRHEDVVLRLRSISCDLLSVSFFLGAVVAFDSGNHAWTFPCTFLGVIMAMLGYFLWDDAMYIARALANAFTVRLPSADYKTIYRRLKDDGQPD